MGIGWWGKGRGRETRWQAGGRLLRRDGNGGFVGGCLDGRKGFAVREGCMLFMCMILNWMSILGRDAPSA